jgi:hypothetical protein
MALQGVKHHNAPANLRHPRRQADMATHAMPAQRRLHCAASELHMYVNYRVNPTGQLPSHLHASCVSEHSRVAVELVQSAASHCLR